MTNMDKLYEAVEARGPVCVGLDTDFSYLPADFVDSTLSKSENIVRFNKKLIDATKADCNCNDSDGKNYNPTATYSLAESEDKKNDCFLATDCIGTEKLVSSEYNTDVFVFADPGVRKLLADIQVEEQNHAEMLYKYKTVNSMS